MLIYKTVGTLALISLLSFCQNRSKDRETITIEGMAVNAKFGAVVMSDETPYYVEGLERWPDDFYNKKVSVEGKPGYIAWEDTERESEAKEQVAKGTGKWKLIKDPTYRVIE